MSKSDDRLGIFGAFRERAAYALGLTSIATISATVLVYIFHAFHRPDLQALNTSLAFIVSIVVALPICYVVSGLINNLKATQSALEASKRRAEEADVAKSEFLANMSHEIRTPMNGVLGMTELLSTTTLDGRQKLFVDTISRSGAALMTIINDILDFSKIEAGRLELDPIPFDFRDAIEDVVSLLTPRAHEKKLELALRIDPDLPRQIVGDAGRIRQIITNLVGNAIKFTHQGYVLIDVAADGPTDGHFRFTISVKDTGIGVPADKVDTIFDKFSQAESSTTRQFGGTGLGLTISRSLAEAMGGSLTATSELGVGSTFVLSFDAPIGEEFHPLDQVSGGFAGKRVLIVDDLDVNRRIESEQLSAWGLDTTTASSGAEGLEMLDRARVAGRPFDLVVTDYHMPVMDGADFVQRLRDDPAAAPEIIVLSSDDTGEGQQRFRALGVTHVHTKPVRSAVLLNSVSAALSRRHDAKADDAETSIETTVVDDQTGRSESSAHRARVLIAEDNEVNRLVVKNMIGDEYDLVFAEDGREAYRLFQIDTFDVVLMDVSMPNMDGYEATKAIRAFEASEGRRRTPIICLTAHALTDERDASLDQGMDDYLSKPIRHAALRDALEKWINAPARDAIRAQA